MKKLCCVITFIVLISMKPVAQNVTPVEILRHSASKLKEYKWIEYDADYCRKFFDSEDTVISPKVHLIFQKEPNDTITGYYLSAYYPESGIKVVYNGEQWVKLSDKHKQVLLADPNSPKAPGLIRNNTLKEQIPDFVLSGNAFEQIASDPDIILSAEKCDTLMHSAWKVHAVYKTDGDITHFSQQYLIDCETFLPIALIVKATFLNIQEQYSCLQFSHFKGHTQEAPQEYFSADYPEEYELEVFSVPEKNRRSLEIGSVFIPFSGITLSGDTIHFNTDFFEKNLVLLDFWFLGCAFCLESMPDMALLLDEYKHKGLIIIGVNPVDKYEKAGVISQILQKKGVSYQVVLTNSEMAKQYLIYSYPTVYLFNSGKLIFKHIGSKDSIARTRNALDQANNNDSGK